MDKLVRSIDSDFPDIIFMLLLEEQIFMVKLNVIELLVEPPAARSRRDGYMLLRSTFIPLSL